MFALYTHVHNSNILRGIFTDKTKAFSASECTCTLPRRNGSNECYCKTIRPMEVLVDGVTEYTELRVVMKFMSSMGASDRIAMYLINGTDEFARNVLEKSIQERSGRWGGSRSLHTIQIDKLMDPGFWDFNKNSYIK